MKSEFPQITVSSMELFLFFFRKLIWLYVLLSAGVMFPEEVCGWTNILALVDDTDRVPESSSENNVGSTRVFVNCTHGQCATIALQHDLAMSDWTQQAQAECFVQRTLFDRFVQSC